MNKVQKVNILPKKHSEQFIKFLKNLPDKEIINFINTQAQLEHWLISKGINNAISDCFNARFSGGNDPILYLKQSGEGNYRYQQIWLSVLIYESLWSLIQISFEDIKKIYKENEIILPFSNAWNLFLDCVRYQENSVFGKCLQPSCNSINLKRDSKAAKLIRNSIWYRLSKEEKIELNKLTKEQPVNPWLRIVYDYCKKLSKTDFLIAQHYKNFRSNIASSMELQIKILSDNSKGKLNYKFKSTYWIDGNVYRGQKNGGQYS